MSVITAATAKTNLYNRLNKQKIFMSLSLSQAKETMQLCGKYIAHAVVVVCRQADECVAPSHKRDSASSTVCNSICYIK